MQIQLSKENEDLIQSLKGKHAICRMASTTTITNSAIKIALTEEFERKAISAQFEREITAKKEKSK